MDNVGAIIRSRRKEFGLTQAQLAKLAKVGVNTLAKIENDEGNPTVDILKRVLKTLGMQLTATVIEV
jgi:y4mF family transcriptional regulator